MTLAQAMRIAVEHHNAGRLAEAETIYRHVLAQCPDHADALHLLGVLAGRAGQFGAELDLIQRAIASNPAVAEYHRHLAECHRKAGRWEEAIAAYHRATDRKPDLAEAYHGLGIVLKTLGRLDEAIAAYHQTIALRPGKAAAHCNLGDALFVQGRIEEAIAACDRAIQLQPDLAEAHNNRGNALRHRGSLDEAIAAYGRAIQIKPAYAVAHSNLGNALRDQGELDRAIAAYRRATQLEPENAEAWNNLGIAWHQAGRLDDAIAAYDRALALGTDLAHAWTNRGMAFRDQGRQDEALACLRKARALNPHLQVAASNLVYGLLFHPDYDARALLEEHRRWDERFARPLARLIQPHRNEPAPDRRLRIGYVSADFRDHVLGHNLMPLFREHDHRHFEIVCYADVIRRDAFTRDFQTAADLWRDVAGKSDDEVARLVRADRIDILVDLALHTAGNRLLTFARKPAPVQVTFAGYPGTTGLAAIDYRLTDPYLDPPGSDDAGYAEESVRLPATFWCYEPLSGGPDVNPLPANENGSITFGSLSGFARINASVLALWARVLRAVDRSCLLLLAPDGAHRALTREQFEREGVAPDRVVFVTRQPRREYLECYHGIDVVLDTFPYSGHTTSLDALWMGVPVVTLAGRTVVGRAGLSQLTNLRLPELVATTPVEYVRIAVALAGDLPYLSALRAGMRDHMRNSPLMDAPAFARGVEAAYRVMWQRWCARSSAEERE
jgi:predicted O-linked N-acetylglucosamine transferase (SPINDLY family)